jgi:hypothetical protein
MISTNIDSILDLENIAALNLIPVHLAPGPNRTVLESVVARHR